MTNQATEPEQEEKEKEENQIDQQREDDQIDQHGNENVPTDVSNEKGKVPISSTDPSADKVFGEDQFDQPRTERVMIDITSNKGKGIVPTSSTDPSADKVIDEIPPTRIPARQNKYPKIGYKSTTYSKWVKMCLKYYNKKLKQRGADYELVGVIIKGKNNTRIEYMPKSSEWVQKYLKKKSKQKAQLPEVSDRLSACGDKEEPDVPGSLEDVDPSLPWKIFWDDYKKAEVASPEDLDSFLFPWETSSGKNEEPEVPGILESSDFLSKTSPKTHRIELKTGKEIDLKDPGTFKIKGKRSSMSRKRRWNLTHQATEPEQEDKEREEDQIDRHINERALLDVSSEKVKGIAPVSSTDSSADDVFDDIPLLKMAKMLKNYPKSSPPVTCLPDKKSLKELITFVAKNSTPSQGNNEEPEVPAIVESSDVLSTGVKTHRIELKTGKEIDQNLPGTSKWKPQRSLRTREGTPNNIRCKGQDIYSSLKGRPDWQMDAICALYRHMTGEDAKTRLSDSHHENVELIVQVLTSGNVDGPCIKTAEELEDYFMGSVAFCSCILSIYSRELFSLYYGGRDPYFFYIP